MPAPTPTTAPDGDDASDVVVRNDTTDSLTFFVECENTALRVEEATFTLAPGEERVVTRVAKGTFCVVHTETRDHADTVVLPDHGAALIDVEDGDRPGYGGAWLCDPRELFVARDHDNRGVEVDILIVGARPAPTCTIVTFDFGQPSSLATASSSDFPWPLVALGGFFGALVAFAIGRVVSGRDGEAAAPPA